MTTTTLPEPLRRHEDEPTKAHQALVDYALLGVGRSLEKLENQYRSDTTLIRPPTRQRSTLASWSVRWEWQERVASYDECLAADRLAEDDRKWRERREEHRERAWDLAQRLFQRAEELLSFPVVEVTVETSQTKSEDGTKVFITQQVIKPAKWTQSDIARLVETYDKIARLAAGMDTEQQRLVIEGLPPEKLRELSDEELDQLEQNLIKKVRSTKR